MNRSNLSRRQALAGVGALIASPALAQPSAGVVHVELVTGQGKLLFELYGDKAPITTANFLRYVADRLYDRSKIYRAMKARGAPADAPPTGIVQGGARIDPAHPHKPIAHEPTSQTGLAHKDGTISMARLKPGSATSDFFICVGDQPFFDADPKASGDNLGFAAFGQVTQGMDLVRAILAMPTSSTKGPPGMVGQMLDPPVPIITARRLA
jgi:peptidyl-prolyl cis-trans isomerase A (cyclophilin A)